MENDDEQVGRILSRREALILLGGVSAAWLAACAPAQTATLAPTSTAPTLTPTIPPTLLATLAGTSIAAPATAVGTAIAAAPSCIVRPALTEGPYFVDEKLNRSDVRPDPTNGTVKEGLPLQIIMNVSQINSNACTPLAGATVDIWHCDALGVYSDASDPSFNTKGQKFLRGYQTTDSNGQVQFTTIYPGWYRGRAVHIHFKIRTPNGSNATYDFTSQFFFDDALSDQVHAQAPYASKGQRDLRNSGDGIFNGGGDQLILALTPAVQGYTTHFDLGLQID